MPSCNGYWVATWNERSLIAVRGALKRLEEPMQTILLRGANKHRPETINQARTTCWAFSSKATTRVFLWTLPTSGKLATIEACDSGTKAESSGIQAKYRVAPGPQRARGYCFKTREYMECVELILSAAGLFELRRYDPDLWFAIVFPASYCG
jgi:hypothetical protein